MRKTTLQTICVIAGLSAGVYSTSMLANETGLYVGGAYGLVSVDDSEFDDDNTAPQLFAGWQINPYIGIEGGYTDFGRSGGDLASSDIDGYSVAATGRLPLTDSFSLFAKAGRFWWGSDVRVGSFSDSFSGNELTYGAGMQFGITESLDLRVAYDRLDVDLERDEIGPIASGDFDSRVDVLSAGLKFTF
ncbi:MAG: outer membrane beta-barrel protein [Pseudohongiella sp.]|uniref:outer membrane beta-barrel protein n=1 Tax=Pseudohongiella sp. TaxID=1979412 RepID=UPI0034A07A92